MDNFKLKEEARRIAKKLVKIYESDKSLDEIFHSLLNKNFEEYNMKVLLYVSDALLDENYALESAKPFKLKKI